MSGSKNALAGVSRDAFSEAFDKVSVWIEALRHFPGFNDWKKKSIAATLTYGDPWSASLEIEPEMFVFPPHIVQQHDAITRFLALHSTCHALADTEYYFRRYPFSGLPVSLDEHLRYTCENFFSRIYEFSEKLKECLNALNAILPNKLDVGTLIKLYAKDFKVELKERNLIHHHARFDDIVISKISMTGLMAIGDRDRPPEFWKGEQRRAYRQASREWAERARNRSARMRDFLNAVAVVVRDQCHFLTEPIVANPD